MEEKKCLKCGRPCRENQAFCDDCLGEMKNYPVKPGVVVLLPRQAPSSPRPVNRRRSVSLNDQVVKLKKRVVGLWLALVLALCAIGGLTWFVVHDYLEDQKNTGPLPGQNYSSENSTTPADSD